ncbi:PAS domain-containing protein [Brucella sp. 21LCYQ03]|nr:PAS domain-containing protein [Brucella sp. 21LCYQ03]
MDDRFFFLPVSGQASAEIRNIDWSQNPLGVPENWPGPLKTAVQMMLASHFPKAIAWGPEFITFYNDAFKQILRDKKNCMGKSFSKIWAEVWEDIGPIAEKAMQGEATFIEDFPLIVNRSGFNEQCYFTFCYSPIFDEDGSVGGMMDTVIETTGKVEAEKNAQIMNAELAHRIKNTFSIVGAIASQTFKSQDNEEELSSFSRRLFALSSAHSVLQFGKSSSGSFAQIIHEITAALGVDQRIDIEGIDIFVGPKAASSTSLLIHELTTNAIKYGALSNETGRVSIGWNTSDHNGTATLFLNWCETGGPEIVKPDKLGFGSKLIKMGLMGTGNVVTDYTLTGLRARMSAPIHQMQGEGRLYNDK